MQDLAIRLNAQIRAPKTRLGREAFERLPWFWFLQLPLKYVLNQMKRNWRFKQEELCFISNTLASFFTTLDQSIKPSFDILLALRMDFVMAESLINNHLFGAKELDAVDHQASHPDQFWGTQSGVPELADESVA